MIHVAPLFRSRFRLPARRRAPGPHGFVCLPQAKRCGQVDPDHERPSFRRREPAGVHHARAVRAQGVVRAQDRYERRCRRRHRISGALLVLRGRGANRDTVPPRGCAGRWNRRRRPGHHRSSTCVDGSGRARDGGRRVPLLRGLAQRSLLLRHAGGVERSAVHRRRFLHRQGRVQHRAGNAQLCPWT